MFCRWPRFKHGLIVLTAVTSSSLLFQIWSSVRPGVTGHSAYWEEPVIDSNNLTRSTEHGPRSGSDKDKEKDADLQANSNLGDRTLTRLVETDSKSDEERNKGVQEHLNDPLTRRKIANVNQTMIHNADVLIQHLMKQNEKQKDQVLHDILTNVDLSATLLRFLSQPAINSYSNSTILTPPTNPCSDKRTKVFIMVPSAPENFDRRMEVRKSALSDFVTNSQGRAKLLFFIGKPNTYYTHWAKIQTNLTYEAIQFGDLVQENFLDVYHNIRLKSMSMLRWVSLHCSHVSYIVRHDDDVTVHNLTASVQTLERQSEIYENFIVGVFSEMNGHRPNRSRESKYFMSKEEYPLEFYPPFSRGGFLGFPILTVQLLFEASLRVPPIWLDDVYITGICADHIGAKKISTDEFSFEHTFK